VKPALLVVDLQNEFFADDSPALPSLRAAVEYVNAAIGLFRKLGAPVVVVRDLEEPARVPGAASFEVHPSVEVEPGDAHVDKRFCNAFWKTDLEERLRAQGVDFVVVTGFCAEYCVFGTFRGAQERGFGAAVLRNAIASPRREHIEFVERICDVISYGALAAVLGQGEGC